MSYIEFKDAEDVSLAKFGLGDDGKLVITCRINRVDTVILTLEPGNTKQVYGFIEARLKQIKNLNEIAPTSWTI